MKKIHKIYLISLIIIAAPFVALRWFGHDAVKQDPYTLSRENPDYVETLIEVDLPNIAQTKSEYKNGRWLAHDCTFEYQLSDECINQLEQLCKENDKWKKENNNGETRYRYYHCFSYPGREHKSNIIECDICSTGCWFSYTPDPGPLMGAGIAMVILPFLAIATIIVWTIILYSIAGIIYLIRKRIKNNRAIESHL